jgi:hypothetical protein
MEMYQLSQIITQPTRVIQTTASLLDVCITSNSENVVSADVFPLGISDHNLIYVVRRAGPKAWPHSHKNIEIRNFKHFNCNSFHDDLYNQPWDHIDQESNTDRKWSLWKSLFLEVFDKHAPLKLKRIRTKHNIPWLNQNTKNLIRERDRLKGIAMITKRETDWNAFSTLRNRATNTIYVKIRKIIIEI